MSGGHLRMKLVFGLVIPWEGLLGYLLLVGEVLQALIQRLESYMSRSISLHSLCTHNFSIIDGLLFLL